MKKRNKNLLRRPWARWATSEVYGTPKTAFLLERPASHVRDQQAYLGCISSEYVCFNSVGLKGSTSERDILVVDARNSWTPNDERQGTLAVVFNAERSIYAVLKWDVCFLKDLYIEEKKTIQENVLEKKERRACMRVRLFWFADLSNVMVKIQRSMVYGMQSQID